MYRHLAILTVVLAACADASDVDAPNPVEPRAPAAQQAPTPTGEPTAEEPLTDPIAGARELVVQGALQRLVNLGETLTFDVHYVDQNGGVDGERVRARLMVGQENVDAVEGSGLLALNVNTDADGQATFEVRAGQVESAFDIELSAEGAPSVRIAVRVSRSGGGELVVEVEAPDAPSGMAQVALYEDDACATLADGGTMAFAAALPTIDLSRGVTSSASNLAHGARYSVQVTVPGIAGGCLDGVEIVGGETTRVVVPIELSPLAFKGRYALEQVIDVRDLVGAQSDIVQTVARVGGGVDGSRGQAIVRLVCEHADLNAVLCVALRAFGGGIIDDIIEREVDPQVVSALTVFGDLYRLLRELTAYGEIEITAQTAGARLEGNVHRVHGLRFVWRDGCPHDDVEACTFSLGFDEMGLADPEALFAANVDGDTFAIEPHGLRVPLDRVAVLLAEQWLLPEALGEAGPVTIADLMGRLLPCDSIAAQLPFGTLSEGLCEDVLPGALADLLVDQLIDALPASEVLTLEGEATVFDAEGDRRADGLVDGEWTGARIGHFAACRADALCD